MTQTNKAKIKYSVDQIETALCLWEAMLEMRPKLPELDKRWKSHGTSALRSSVYCMVEECDEQWEALTKEEKDAIAFDWEFVPAFIAKTFAP
jgi:hypothetical protein